MYHSYLKSYEQTHFKPSTGEGELSARKAGEGSAESWNGPQSRRWLWNGFPRILNGFGKFQRHSSCLVESFPKTPNVDRFRCISEFQRIWPFAVVKRVQQNSRPASTRMRVYTCLGKRRGISGLRLWERLIEWKIVRNGNRKICHQSLYRHIEMSSGIIIDGSNYPQNARLGQLQPFPALLNFATSILWVSPITLHHTSI